MAKDKTNSCEADPNVYGSAAIFGVFLVSVVVRVRGWMVQRRVPGCSCVFMRMCPFLHKNPTIRTIYDKNTNAFSKIDFFDEKKRPKLERKATS